MTPQQPVNPIPGNGSTTATPRGQFLQTAINRLIVRFSDGQSRAWVGCGPTTACGSMLSEQALGRSIAECGEFTADDLIEALDGVPPDKLHCPALPIGALQHALSHWEQREDF